MSARGEDLQYRLLVELIDEMCRQDEQWGWPRPAEFLPVDRDQAVGELFEGEDLDLGSLFERCEVRARQMFRQKCPSWSAILGEEIGEVARATDPYKRVFELVQAAAVSLSWAQAILEHHDLELPKRAP